MARVQKEHLEAATNSAKKKRPKEDILEIVKEFITYFEAADRGEKQ